MVVSTSIGKDQPVAAQQEAAAQQKEQVAEAVTKEDRASKFRSALGQAPPKPAGPGGPGGPNQTDRSGQAGKSDGKREAGRGEKEKEGPSLERSPLGLTEEQTAALAALGGVGGADGKKGGRGGQGDFGPEDLALGALGGLGKGVARSPNEEAMIDVAAAVSQAAQPAQGQSWARPEGPMRAETRSRNLPQYPGVDPIHQLLIGKGPNGSEARMLITVGPLAGSEIRLKEGPGGLMAEIIAQNASAKQTLVSAMEAVSQRLKLKGHKLDLNFGQAGQQGQGARFSEQPGQPRR